MQQSEEPTIICNVYQHVDSSYQDTPVVLSVFICIIDYVAAADNDCFWSSLSASLFMYTPTIIFKINFVNYCRHQKEHNKIHVPNFKPS